MRIHAFSLHEGKAPVISRTMDKKGGQRIKIYLSLGYISKSARTNEKQKTGGINDNVL
jgi:hypothetical protein